ncbi:MAG: peptidylprolyl isomerase [Cyclobacteriaceae bacterium]|nr:peptidylprolyl isomerase [Cyclobacteriaceae bacterium]
MKKIIILLFIALAMSACKPKSIDVTKANVREVLTQYGKDNPENEVLIETDFGNIKLKLYDETPLHRANFVKLIKEGNLDDAEFYRVVNEFMIQGGEPALHLPYQLPAEFNPKYFHKRGALSMARPVDDNPAMESSAEQFFIIMGTRYTQDDLQSEMRYFGLHLTPEQQQTYITQGGSMDLDQRFTVFGEVTEGIEVVDKIAKLQIQGTEAPSKKVPMKITLTKVK